MDHSSQVYFKTVKILESLQGACYNQIEEISEQLKPLKNQIESENEQLLIINERIAFLSEILALKKQVNSVSETRLKILVESTQAIEKEIDENKIQPLIVPIANCFDIENIKEEISQKEKDYELLSECISKKVCYNCFTKLSNIE